MCSRDNVEVKKIPQLWKFQNFFRISVVALVNVITSVIGGFDRKDQVRLAASTVRLQVSDYSQLSDYTVRLQLYRMTSEK